MSDRALESVSRKSLLQLGAAFGLVTAIGSAPAAVAPREGVVGAWTLESFQVDEGKGTAKPRFGPNPVGYLLYTADDRMAAVLGGTHRPELRSPTGSANSEEQRTESISNFLAYAGRYEIRGDRVYHHVEVSLFTNLQGTTLIRQFEIEGDTLTIRTLPPEIWNSSNVLVWHRA